MTEPSRTDVEGALAAASDTEVHRADAEPGRADAGVDRADAQVDRADAEVDRADRVAQKLAVPVLVAALASVPAVFLSLMAEPWGAIGDGLNTLSGAVLIAETVVLLALADDRRAWVRRNRWLVLLAVAIVPAVVFAVGPVQLLRLVRVVRVFGALRIIRVGRIMKAGRIVRERSGLDHGWQRAIGVVVTLAAAAFVAIVLVDPTSESRQMLAPYVGSTVDRLGVFGIVLAGMILAVATYVVRSARERRGSALPDDPPSDGDTLDGASVSGTPPRDD